MNHLPVVRTPQEGRTVAVVGDVYRFLATGQDTAGKYAMWEALVPPGGGPPPHVHPREDEAFYVLEGEITFGLGEETIVATAGMFVNAPSGSVHHFKNSSDRPSRMIISIVPAGLEELFFEVGTQLPEGSQAAHPPTPEEIQKLLAASSRYGIEFQMPGH